MKLSYHLGQNFGDAINPIIFNHFLPDFFDESTDIIFIGIGSILGLKKGDENTRLKIVFSSGFAAGQPGTYGHAPVIDNTYDVCCVRGPLTAEKLGLAPNKAVADGAILISDLVAKPEKKRFRYSFLLHHVSENYFNWKEFLDHNGINFISTKEDPLIVCEKIAASEFVVTEAMHGAIIADALRTPWLPINCYGAVNEFKWRDFALSMETEYSPVYLKGPFGKPFLERIMAAKTGNPFLQSVGVAVKRAQSKLIFESGLKKWLKELEHKHFFLSKSNVLYQRQEQLKELLAEVREKYKL